MQFVSQITPVLRYPGVICIPGYPRPKVSWWLGEAMVDDSFQEVSSSVLRNSLVIAPVTRAHIHAVLSCRASASPVSVASATVTIDMYREWHLR